MSTHQQANSHRDTKYMVLYSCLAVYVLLGIMFFSSIGEQYYYEYNTIRGTSNEIAIDSLVKVGNYQLALDMTDSLIANKSRGLRQYAYFDRYLPERERYEASIQRAEVYDLRWKRIEILLSWNHDDELYKALKDYSKIIGYHQEEANALLNQLKNK